jgi:hypothetical protein
MTHQFQLWLHIERYGNDNLEETSVLLCLLQSGNKINSHQQMHVKEI